MLKDKTVVIGVSGGIAVYKTLDVVSRLRKLGVNVNVIMTKSATEFVTPLSFQSLSNIYVVCDMFEDPKTWDVEHISLAKRADVFLIAPATSNVIGKIANGIADDFGNKVEIFLFPILLLIITLLTGKENIKYFLTHSKTFLTDIQYNLMIDGVLGIVLIAEIYVIYASFV